MPQTPIEFYLPLGLTVDGKLRRKGRMRPPTTGDELAVQEAPDLDPLGHQRDLALLARLISDLDGASPVTPEILEELFEADFLYLQLIYREINGDAEIPRAACPLCGAEFSLSLPRLYENMGPYRQDKTQG